MVGELDAPVIAHGEETGETCCPIDEGAGAQISQRGWSWVGVEPGADRQMESEVAEPAEPTELMDATELCLRLGVAGGTEL